MNHVRKLALHGMRGRRKDTRVLALVIVMSFLFLTAGCCPPSAGARHGSARACTAAGTSCMAAGIPEWRRV